MEKVIRDGKVGVLVSPGFGAGFYSWGYPLEAIFDPTLIELVENQKFQEAVDYCESKWPKEYSGGVGDLRVVWVPEGKEFIIEEYDGSESLMLKEEYNWITA
jgi:hypothetical protein